MKNKIFSAAIVLIWACSVWADPIDDLTVRLAKTAVTSEDLQAYSQQIGELRSYLAACDIQKAEHLLPSSCYQFVELVGRISPNAKLGPTKHQVDKWCLQIAAETNEEQLPTQGHFSKDCLDVAETQLKVNRYKRGHDI